ncbi:MAG: hypothetical protein M3384_18880, partial [Acidobacteriota bacterium]|nr:hypothetical protein [Acidobacteriota bacterium]
MRHLSKFAISCAFVIFDIGNVFGQTQSSSPTPVSFNDWTSKDFLTLILQAVGLLTGVILSSLQLRNLVSKSRSTLKTDVEIFKMLKPEDPGYEHLKKHVAKSIENIYSSSERRNFIGIKVYSWDDFILGVVFLLIFPIATFYLYRYGYNVWALVTGFLVLAGIGGILNGLDRKKAPKNNNEA